MHRLYETAAIDPRNLPRVAAHLAESVESLRTLVRNAEMQLDQGADTATPTAISRTLYDPTSDAIFARPEHLPERVGSLVPTCVAALLCERDAAVPMRSAS